MKLANSAVAKLVTFHSCHGDLLGPQRAEPSGEAASDITGEPLRLCE